MRIALVHALAESVAPAHAAFARQWPEAVPFDVLDTSLSMDLARAGRLTPAISERIGALADYALATGEEGNRTAAVLYTCSAFGPAIDAVKRRADVPVLRPNESAFREALGYGDDIGLVVSFAPSAPSLMSEIREMSQAAGRNIRIHTLVAEGALAALQAGDGASHDEIVARTCRGLEGVDVLVLGQFSLARAAPKLAETGFKGRVVTTPDAAVRELRQRVGAGRKAVS